MDHVKIIECPRDAWQGIAKIIPTEAKVAYLEKLIEAGFRHLDAVSFVSPKYVPQMAESEAVMKRLLDSGLVAGRPNGEPAKAGHAAATSGHEPPEIIGIVVNERGLERALQTPGVTTIGYPYSVSANFRRQNANMSLSESRALVEQLQKATKQAQRDLVVYVSMAFGNNYDEPWSPEVTADAVEWLTGVGVKSISLADTIGTAKPEQVGEVFKLSRDSAKNVELGIHLHSRPEGAAEKIVAAFEAGCRRFDSALTGLGGCPFAGDDLVGNIATETVVSALAARGAKTAIEPWALLAAVEATNVIRRDYIQA